MSTSYYLNGRWLILITHMYTSVYLSGKQFTLNNTMHCFSRMMERTGMRRVTPRSNCYCGFFHQFISSWTKWLHFADDISRCIFANEKLCIIVIISLKFVPKGPIDKKQALVQIMAWWRIGHKPLFEPKLTRFTDSCIGHWGGGWGGGVGVGG